MYTKVYIYIHKKIVISMHYTKFQDIIDGLLSRGIHTVSVNELAKLLDKPRNYASLLARKNKRLHRIENGKYALVGADIFEIASNIVNPSYVSLFSAIRYYNLTNQIPISIEVITIRRHRLLKTEGYTIKFINFKKERFFGYTRIGNTYIATAEKAIIDSLYLNTVPYDEVKGALTEGIEKGLIKLDTLKRYAIHMNSKMVIGRILLLLNTLDIDTNGLKQLTPKNKVSILGMRGVHHD